MNIFICFNSFKNSISAIEVNKYVHHKLKNKLPYVNIISFPLGDGGEGTLDLIKNSISNHEIINTSVINAIGKQTDAYFIILNNKTAFIEMAQASGIEKINKNELNPFYTTTYGTGELISKALNLGIKEVIISLGGSATIDGGVGLCNALGVDFFDKKNNKLHYSQAILHNFYNFHLSPFFKKIKEVKFTILTDVNNPLCGNSGAANVFGPQKGVKQNEINIFDDKLKFWAEKLQKHTNINLINTSGIGAAGGIALPLLIAPKSEIKPAFTYLDKLFGYSKNITNCDLLITGEGCFDNQSFMGKGIGQIINMAINKNKKIIVITGENKIKISTSFKIYSLTDYEQNINKTIHNPLKYIDLVIDNIISDNENFN